MAAGPKLQASSPAWYAFACLLVLQLLSSHHRVKALQSLLLLAIQLASPLTA